MSLYRQKQLQEEENTIPERSITKWHLDCMKECYKSEAFEMAIRHYSCVNDEVVVYSIGRISDDLFLNRKIHHRSIENIKTNIMDTFKHSSYFYSKHTTQSPTETANIQPVTNHSSKKD